jgi:iron-sulfur cluster assembly accessory protein
MITITDKAIGKLREFADAEGCTLSVRVSVNGSGCSGFSFALSFEDVVGENDEAFDVGGVKVIVDMMSAQYLGGITMDFHEGVFESGFKFSGGEIKSTCGCGNSVAF